MSRFSYGLNYLGSKNTLCNRLFKNVFDMNNCDNFVDLFGGGGSISHYCLSNYPKVNVIYNEINKEVCQLFENATSGKLSFLSEQQIKEYCNYYMMNYKKRKIIKDDIYLLCKYLMTFAGKFDSYGYGKFKNIDEIWDFLEKFGNNRILKNYERYQNLSSVNKKRLDIYNCDYQLFLMNFFSSMGTKQQQKNIIYCDIPYKNKSGYNIFFNQEQFLNDIIFCAQDKDITNSLFYISSYEINDCRFKCVFEENKRLNIQNKQNIPTERIYIPITQEDTIIKLF